MQELTIHDIERMLKENVGRVLEVKQSTGELNEGMHSGCAFLNTEGGWLLFGGAEGQVAVLQKCLRVRRYPLGFDGQEVAD